MIIGYGQMGKWYTSLLLQKEGFRQTDIAVVDHKDERLEDCRKQYPELATYPNLEAALNKQIPATAFVLTNSLSHAPIIGRLVAAGVKNILVEKPLVVDAQDCFALRPQVIQRQTKLVCGYLMNFSPALERLRQILEEKSLYVLGAIGSWGKDRVGDSRPTTGNLDDESTHVVCLMLAAVRFNQHIHSIRVHAVLDYLGYVNAEAQAEARQHDFAYPDQPVSTSQLALRVQTDVDAPRFLFARSSFVAFGQTRCVELQLGQKRAVTHMARLSFDTAEGDIFEFKQAGSKTLAERTVYPGHNKLADQVHAFLYSSPEADARLVDFERAAEMVNVSFAAQIPAGKDFRSVPM